MALAYAHYNRGRAEKELRHLFEAQWSNGLLPQIVFNPRFRDYFPDPASGTPAKARTLPSARETSGVVMPPVHATAVLAVYKGSGKRRRSSSNTPSAS